MTKISNCPHKDELCLISLTTDLRKKMTNKGYDPDDAIKNLKGIGVDVCDLTIQSLSKINQYRLVIIICHHIQSQDIDALVLSDNTLLPVDVFVNAISKEFTGLLDLAICQSKEMAYAIKALSKFSDSIRIQYAEEGTDVEFRLCYIYPDLLKYFSFDPIDDYKERYIEAYRKAVQYAIRRQNEGVKDPNSLHEGTKLGGGESSGDVKTTVYSPLRVVRGERFNIWIAMHFDADNGTLFIDERNNDPRLKDVKARKHNVVLNNIHYGDELSIKISFEDGNDNPTELISVTNNNPKSFRLSDKIVPLKFRVFVDTGYPYDYFTAILEYIKDGHCLKKFDNLIYGFESVYPQYDTKQGRLQITIGGDKSYQTKDPGAFNITSNKEGSAEILTYKQSPNDTIFHDAIDVEKVKKVLPTFKLKTVVTGIKYWFVVHKVLEEIHWLQKKQDTLFIQWVKDVYGWEWKTEDFKSVNKAFKYKDNCREELLSIHWSAATTKDGKTGIAYKKLSDDIRKELVTIKEDGTIEDKTYFLKKDRYLFHPQKLV